VLGAWAFSSHGADAIEPLTTLSQSSIFFFNLAPLVVSLELLFGRVSPFGRLARVARMRWLPRPFVSAPR